MLDPGGALPLYQQLKQALRKLIEAGTWAPNTAIPPERELIQRFGVSRITVRQALSDLVADGLLYRQHGRGTFVAPHRAAPIATTLNRLTGYLEDLQNRGFDPEVEVLAVLRAPLPDDVAQALGRPAGVEAWHLRRRVLVDRRPLMLLEGYLPVDLGIGLGPEALAHTPVPRLLEEFGLVPVQGTLRIGAAEATDAEAGQLGVRPGAALLCVTRVITGRDGAPLEWTRALYRADRYQYEIELRRR